MNKNNKIIIVIILSMSILALLNVNIEVVSPGEGVIEKGSGKIDIISPASGIISDFDIDLGEELNAGHLIFNIGDIEITKRINALTNEYKALIDLQNKQQIELNCILQEYLDNDCLNPIYTNTNLFFHEKQVILQSTISIERDIIFIKKEKQELKSQIEILNKQKYILKKSNIPAIEHLRNELLISEINGQILAKDSELTKNKNKKEELSSSLLLKKAVIVNELSEKIQSNITQSNKTYGDLLVVKSKNSLNMVISPSKSRVLTKGKNISEGSYIEKGKLVLTLDINDTNKTIKGRFASKYRNYIMEDMRVKGVINAPGERHVFDGRITNISSDSFKYDEKNESNRYYEVDIIVKDNNSNIYGGVNVMLFAIKENIPLFQYIFGLIYKPLMFTVG